MTTLDVNDKVFVRTLDHFVGSIAWLLQGSAGGVMAYIKTWVHVGSAGLT